MSRGGLLRFTREGERVKKASAVLEREASHLATAIRRAVPFLARRGIPVTLQYARAMAIADLIAELPRPLYAHHVRTEPGGGRGALVFDAVAIAMLIDGALGGNGATTGASGGQLARPTDRQVLSPAQSALMSRIAGGITQAISGALDARAGVRLSSSGPKVDDAETESTLIACSLELGSVERDGEGSAARIVLLIPKEALLARDLPAPEAMAPPADPRISAVLEDVEVELVATLAKVPIKLAAVEALKVGDTLRLDVPVGSLVSVCVEGQPLLRGIPTTSGGRIAIRVDRHES